MASNSEDNFSAEDLSSSSDLSELSSSSSALEELVDSNDNEDDFEGLLFDFPVNMTWEKRWIDINTEPFQLTPGPTVNFPDSGRAIDFLMLYFTEEIIGKIVEFTNKNAQLKGVQNWRPITAAESKAFLAFLIISNDIIVKPRDKRFFLSFAETRPFQIPEFKNVLSSRKRFFKLKSYIFFCHPVHQRSEEERKDPLYEVRGIYNSIVQKFKELYNCSREISIDEAMVPFKGKVAIKVRMPDKPVTFGVKFFALCDAKTGYCKNFSMYTGKDDRAIGAIGKTGQVVMDLVAELHNTNHHLCVDNFYTSPVLFLLFKQRGILAAGTARPRKGYPYDQLKGTVLQKHGDVAWILEKDRKMRVLR